MGPDYFLNYLRNWNDICVWNQVQGKPVLNRHHILFLNLSLRFSFCPVPFFLSIVLHVSSWLADVACRLHSCSQVCVVALWCSFCDSGRVLWLCCSVHQPPATYGYWAFKTWPVPLRDGFFKLYLILIHLNISCHMWLGLSFWTVQPYTRKPGIDWLVETSTSTFSLPLIF